MIMDDLKYCKREFGSCKTRGKRNHKIFNRRADLYNCKNLSGMESHPSHPAP